MKKLLAILLGACLLLGVMTGCGGNAEDAVTVQKVSDITSQGSVGLVNRYAGIVVSGETATVKKGDKKVLETYVKEGDFVTEGDVLFCYDNEAMELQLSKLLLELEGYENTISNAEEDIPNLERQRDAAPAAQQLTYSLQIQELQANVREATYNKGLKEREIENLQEALEDTDVRAPISGRVMSVKNTENTGASSGYGDDTSGSDAYITIMDMTTYQVKGTINELNVGTLSEGMNVLIRSRLDESVTWSGVLDSIDWETKVQTNNSPYYGGGGGNEMTSSSKYPFYVKLNDVTGLILGQHVYIEPDYGQQEVREGLWPPEYYIVDADSSPYVWAANGRDRLEKRGVSLGEYDAERGEYQVISGLKESDYIAFPMDGLTAGMHTQVYEDNSGVCFRRQLGRLRLRCGSNAADACLRRQRLRRRRAHRSAGRIALRRPRRDRSAGGGRRCAGDSARGRRCGECGGERGIMLLEMRSICKDYPQGKDVVHILKNISLEIDDGDYLAIMGPSGSGKTTLMNIIGCLDTPTSGTYVLAGEDVSSASDDRLADIRNQMIGFVFQSFYLLPKLTALDNVALPLLYANVPRRERRERAAEALASVGLEDRMDFYPNQLSGGQCQRVAIARAMIAKPRILLADEPTGALDSASGRQVMQILRRAEREGNDGRAHHARAGHCRLREKDPPHSRRRADPRRRG